MAAKRKRGMTVRSEQETGHCDVSVDGSFGEGGGQILRASVALSAVLGKSVRVENIRASRSKPGLGAQHLAGVRAVADLSGASVVNANPGSQWLQLIPSRAPEKVSLRLPRLLGVSGAGSTALVLQAALPVILRFVPSLHAGVPTAIITGGTFAMSAPHSDYIEHVLCPNLKLLGIDVRCNVEQHGFFPRGGGKLTVECQKSRCVVQPDESICLPAIELLKRGDIIDVSGRVIVAGAVSDEIGIRMAVAAKKRLRSRLRQLLPSNVDVNVVMDRIEPSKCLGGKVGAVTLWATARAGRNDVVFGSSGLLDSKSIPAQVAESAADELCDDLQSGACVDSRMADQICIFLAMASGTSRLLIPTPSLHVLSVVEVMKSFGVNCHLRDTDSDLKQFVCEGLSVELCR